MGTLVCEPCGSPFSDRPTQCPHCGRPAVAYPNVIDATRPQEREALALRVADARARAVSRGVERTIARLEHELDSSRAVRTVRSHEVERLVSSDHGDAALFLRDDCIAHRASVFEDNVVLWMQIRGPTWDVPPGYRAPWEARAALGVAKLADQVTEDVDLGQLVLGAGTTTSDDSMLEVHVYGSLTARSIASIDVRAGRVSEQLRQELDERAAECGFTWRAVP